mmetsp:Transcript_48939/g.122294  ORF Transcript_48939/g.122294 Transcript_48939/m.122294 type:complete len:112 (+) Transcript_48939:377-712(+)
MGGSEDARGVVTYGRSLGAHVLVLPADKTVHKECSATYEYNDFCCSRPDMPMCKNQVEDSLLYKEQAGLYATTIGTSGAMEVAPQGSGHGYPSHKDTYLWVVERLMAHFAA